MHNIKAAPTIVIIAQFFKEDFAPTVALHLFTILSLKYFLTNAD
ncbi:hypothetical protein [Delftia lacustris]